MSDPMNRIMAYANAIIGNKKIADNQNETIKRIFMYQPDIIFDAYGVQIDVDVNNTDPTERLAKYVALLGKMPDENDPTFQKERLKAYAERFETVIRSYANYDYSKEGQIEVNGNTFTYKKDSFDPYQYMDELAEVGKSVQGDIFSASVDDEGKLVIY